MDAADAAGRWAAEWARAWRDHDADAVAALYADGARFRSQPFREPHVGPDGARAYAAWAFADEAPGAEVRFGEPFVVGADSAAVEYRAVVHDADGAETTIAGVSLLRFDGDGLVVCQRDYWHQAPGRAEPPPGRGA